MILHFDVEMLPIEYEFEYFVTARDAVLRNVHAMKQNIGLVSQ